MFKVTSETFLKIFLTGTKFANMVVTMALASIIMKFEVLPQNPDLKIEQDPASSLIYMPKGGIWLKFKRY